jgi:drug/metabolite transporter (DMT)-like permease
LEDKRKRLTAFAMLAAAMLIWAGNWVMGRALRDAIDPVSLNFSRWVIAIVVLAPFALPGVLKNRQIIFRNIGLLLLLALTGVTLFHAMVYHGLRTTTAVNGVLLNSSLPLFILLCSWALERERATGRQVAGMLLSFAGIVVIMSQGDFARLRELEFHVGDAWILLAMPVWGIYAVLLKRRPPELGGLAFLFVIALAGVLMLAPVAAGLALHAAPVWPGGPAALGVLYMALGPSLLAFICWNRGVAAVGANAAGFTVHLLPAFGTVLAILFLGEAFAGFHAAGIAVILAGVLLATRPTSSSKTP